MKHGLRSDFDVLMAWYLPHPIIIPVMLGRRPVIVAEGVDFAGEFEHGEGLREEGWVEPAFGQEFMSITDAVIQEVEYRLLVDVFAFMYIRSCDEVFCPKCEKYVVY